MSDSFSWKQLKEIALTIKSNNFFENNNRSKFYVEAWKRNFVSRIYYSSFHESIEIAEEITSYKKLPMDLEFNYDRNKIHGDLLTFYRKISKDYPLPQRLKVQTYNISTNLKELHNMRKDCDYVKFLSENKISYICENSLVLCENISLSLIDLLEHFKSKITK